MSTTGKISKEKTSRAATDIGNTTQRLTLVNTEFYELLPEGSRTEMVTNMYVVLKKVYFDKIIIQF